MVLLPGPPKELTALFADQVRERLRALLPEAHLATGTLRMAVVPESEVDARTAPIYGQYPDVQTTILSTNGEIQLHFLCSKATLAEATARIAEVLGRCEAEMEEVVFSNNNDSLEQVVLLQMGLRNLTLAVAESCTGGLLGERVTSVPGSSRSFAGGAIVYSNALKTSFAGVPEELLQAHGAVSEPVARALAEGIRKRTGASLGIGITGVAGPDGGTDAKPVGRVYIALSDAEGTTARELNLHGDRERIRWMSTQHALVDLRHHLA